MQMRQTPSYLRTVFACVLSVALIVWTASASADHTPRVMETIQDHIQMIAEHGHSHGFEEDLYWAIHGHDHDAADHEHSQVFLIENPGSALPVDLRDTWQRLASAQGPPRQFKIERPPRF